MRSCHVNPVTIPGILRFLPLVCSDYICFLSFLTPVIWPVSVRRFGAGGVEERPQSHDLW